MDFRQLEVFRAIAEELHFGRAAERLFVSQAMVSQSLQRLEAFVGVRLVHRTSKSVQLTGAGTVFLAEIDRVYSAAERAVALARRAGASPASTLRLAANYPASRLLLLPLLERLREREPKVSTVLKEMASTDQVRALRRDELDLALVYGPVSDPDLSELPLLQVPVVAMVRPGHPLAASGVIELVEMRQYPYITGSVGGSSKIAEAVASAAAAAGIDFPMPAGKTDIAGYLLTLETSDTVGFSSLPRGEQGQANGLRMLRLAPVEPMLTLSVVWDRRSDESLVNIAIGELRAVAEQARDA